MTKSNSSATLSTSNLYEHPWYSQLKLLETTMTCESPFQPKLKSEVTGQKSTRQCSICNMSKPLTDFPNHKRDHQHGKDTRCKDCLKKYNQGKAIARKGASAKPEKCQCCNIKTDKLHLDHCHETYAFRGWLCMNCNTGIGRLGDSIEGLTSALNYLKSTNGNQI